MFTDEFIEKLAGAIASRLALVNPARGDASVGQRLAPRWLDIGSAAQLMNTTKDGVRGMARAKLFPVKKMGGRVMIDIRDLERAFEKSTTWL